VRKNAALVTTTTLASLALVFALALFFHLHARPSFLRAFRDYGTELPGPAAVALSAWFLPGALAFAGASAIVALAAPMRRSRRGLLLGTGLVVASFALIFAVLAAFLAVFRPE
jgi:hypothetical protein